MRKNKDKEKIDKLKKPRLFWYKGKLIEKISDNRKNDPKKLRKKWKAERNREY